MAKIEWDEPAKAGITWDDEKDGNFFFRPNEAATGMERTKEQIARDILENPGGVPIVRHTAAPIVGGVEFGLAGLTGLGAKAIGGLETLARIPFQGTNKALEEGRKTAQAGYTPRTDYGQLLTKGFGDVVHSGIEAVGSGVGNIVAPNYLNSIEGRPQDWRENILNREAIGRTIGEAGAEFAMDALPLAGGARAIAARREMVADRSRLQAAADAKKQREFEEANSVSEADVSLWDNENPYVPTAEMPFGYRVEKTQSGTDFQIGQTDVTKPAESLGERYERQFREQHGMASTTEPFPFNTKAHENSVPFPLRQEVLQRPEVVAEINGLREHIQWLEENKAPAELIEQSRQQFGELMASYGVRNAADAHGLNRPLYEGQARALPVEKTLGLADRTGRPKDWADHTPSAFELADMPPETFTNPKGKYRLQEGYVNPEMLRAGYRAAKEVVTRAGEKLSLVSWTAAAKDGFDHLPTSMREFVDLNTAISPRYMKDGNMNNVPVLRVVALNKNGEPLALAEFRKHGEYLESDWTYTTEANQGRGIASTMYNFVRNQGSDIRASIARTPGGKKMWESMSTKHDIQTGRPIMERIQSSSFKGPSKQGGWIKFGEDFSEFKARMKKNFGDQFSDDVIKAAWDDKQKGSPKFESRYNENTTSAVAKIPGLKSEVDKLAPNFKPIEEVKDFFKTVKDIPGDLLAKGARQLQSGAKIVARYYDSPVIKYYADHVSAAEDTIRKNTDKLLFDKDTGVVDAFDSLKAKEQIELWKVIDKHEGIKNLDRAELLVEGLNERQIGVYERLRAATSFVLENINSVRKRNKIAERPGYFPAKFIGDWYVTVKAPALEAGRENLIGIYSANNTRSINKVVKQLKEEHPDWTVSEIIERRPYASKRGSGHALNVYGDLFRILEENDPRAKVLSEIIREHQAEQANYTAGLFQHLKYKKGIEGATGKDAYKSDLENAHNAFKAFQDYVQQSMEYTEIKKLEPTVSKLLDRKEFDNLRNTQEYISQHWDRTRGINNKLAQAMDDVITTFAHAFGISGGAVKGGAAFARSQVMFLMLGYWNPRFLAAQLMQPNQFVFQNMAALRAKGAPVGIADLAESWMKGMYHVYKGGIDRASMEPHARKALEWAEDRRIVEPRMFEDIKTELEKRKDNIMGWVNGQVAIRFTEQKTRTQAFMTFYELVNKAGMKGEQAYQMAADMTRHAMVDYRPFEKPLLYQNLGFLGDMISPLTTFKHNYYSQFAVAIKELIKHPTDPKYLTPVAIALGMQTALSGLMGLPGKEDLDAIMMLLKKAGLIDPSKMDVTQMILSSKLPSYVTHGVSAITGLDMSASFAASSIIPDRSAEVAPILGKAADIVGAGVDAATSRTRSSMYNFAKQVTPATFQNILESAAADGSDVVPKFENRMKGSVRRDEQDWLARSMAMRTIKESKERTMMYKETQNAELEQKAKAKLVERALDAYGQGEDIGEYVKKAVDLGMTPKQFIDAIKDLQKGRNTTDAERFRGLTPKSYNQLRRFQNLERYRD